MLRSDRPRNRAGRQQLFADCFKVAAAFRLLGCKLSAEDRRELVGVHADSFSQLGAELQSACAKLASPRQPLLRALAKAARRTEMIC